MWQRLRLCRTQKTKQNMKKIFKQTITFILTLQAKELLKRHPETRIIVVGGNIGKTGTKDAIFALLSESEYKVRRSLKSFNSELGLPLSILGLPNAWNNPFLWIINIVKGFVAIFQKNYPDILVLELGADKKGDISSAASWLKADVLVLTLIPEIPVHVENFKNKEELFEEKHQLLNLLKDESVLIYDADSSINQKFSKSFKGVKYSFGFDKEADYKILSTKAVCKDGVASGYEAQIQVGKSEKKVALKENIGWQRVKSSLAAMAVCDFLSVKYTDLSAKIDSLPSKGRTRLVPAKKCAVIIDDSYNASPKAVSAAQDILAEFECISGSKITVLADMLELGKFAPEAHEDILKKALEKSDKVYIMGPVFKKIAERFSDDKLSVYGKGEHEKLSSDILNNLRQGDLVLVKGSQSMRMEKVVKGLMQNPQDAKDLLVRQEKEWLTR